MSDKERYIRLCVECGLEIICADWTAGLTRCGGRAHADCRPVVKAALLAERAKPPKVICNEEAEKVIAAARKLADYMEEANEDDHFDDVPVPWYEPMMELLAAFRAADRANGGGA